MTDRLSLRLTFRAKKCCWILSIAGEHLRHQQGGGGYDFDPNQIALIVLPRRYSDNKKILLRYENSTSLPTSVVIRVKDFDDTFGKTQPN